MSDDKKPLRVYAPQQIKQSALAEFSYETAISIAGVSNAMSDDKPLGVYAPEQIK